MTPTPLFKRVLEESQKDEDSRHPLTVRVILPKFKTRAGKTFPRGKTAEIVGAGINPWLRSIASPKPPLPIHMVVIEPGGADAERAKSDHEKDPLSILFTFEPIFSGNTFVFGRAGPDNAKSAWEAVCARWVRISDSVRLADYTRQEESLAALFSFGLLKPWQERTNTSTIIGHEVGHLWGFEHPPRDYKQSIMWVPSIVQDGTPITYRTGWNPGELWFPYDVRMIGLMKDKVARAGQ